MSNLPGFNFIVQGRGKQHTLDSHDTHYPFFFIALLELSPLLILLTLGTCLDLSKHRNVIKPPPAKMAFKDISTKWLRVTSGRIGTFWGFFCFVFFLTLHNFKFLFSTLFKVYNPFTVCGYYSLNIYFTNSLDMKTNLTLLYLSTYS